MFYACENSKIEKTKTLNFDSFEISVPESWQKKEFEGIDFKAEYLLTKENDTIHIGSNYSDYFDESVQVFSIKQIKKYDSLGLDTSTLFYSKTPEVDQDQGVFLKEYYLYDTVDGYSFKKRIPKVIGDGITALGIVNHNNIVIYAKDLPKGTQNKLLEVFNTIKIAQ